MSAQYLNDASYRPCFSGHETFPLRYGWLQKAYFAVSSAASPKEAVHIFRDQDAIARFGVGRNMVSAIRYWATAAGIIDEFSDGLSVSWIGEMLFGEAGLDPYLEDDSSLWLLHWHLASRPRLTSVYWLFNEYRGGSFVRSDLVSALLELANENEWSRVASTTVDRDLQCLLRTYIGGRGSSDAGDSILAELGLIRPVDKQRSRLSRGRKLSLPDQIFLFCLKEFWRDTAEEQSSLSFENIAYSPGSPGKVFLLDEEDIVDRLERLEEVSKGALAWSETAGIRQVSRRSRSSTEDDRGMLRDALSLMRGLEAA